MRNIKLTISGHSDKTPAEFYQVCNTSTNQDKLLLKKKKKNTLFKFSYKASRLTEPKCLTIETHTLEGEKDQHRLIYCL